MTKKSLVNLFWPLFFLLGASFCFIFVYSQDRQLSTGASSGVTLKEIEPFAYFSLRQKGSLDQLDTAINQLLQTAREQNVFPTGSLFIILHGLPTAEMKSEGMEWEVAFPVTPHALVQAPLEKKIWQFSPVAACLHAGSYETAGETVEKILSWMEEKGYQPEEKIMLTFLDVDPSRVRSQELRIEIWIPGKKI